MIGNSLHLSPGLIHLKSFSFLSILVVTLHDTYHTGLSYNCFWYFHCEWYTFNIAGCYGIIAGHCCNATHINCI